MTLTVEDGTGLSTAEAYISVADADAYFAARGNATWAAISTDAEKEQALRKGADYLEGYRWKGERYSSTQALAWPRSYVVVDGYELDADTLPAALVRANAELAVRASAADLSVDAAAQVVQETVGPISVTYAAGARQQTRYEAVERMLASLLLGSGQVPVLRA